MDRDCNIRTRAELDQILDNHNLWIAKFNILRLSSTPLKPSDGPHDPLRADLSGAVLEHADLRGALLDYADLTDTDLESADLSYAHLNCVEMESTVPNQGSNLNDANLRGAELVHADLTEAFLEHADLTAVFADYADLGGASLDYANLGDSVPYTTEGFFGANMAGASLTNARLIEGIFSQADLTGANLTNANLTGAVLDFADLSSSNLTGTDFTGASMTGAILWYADFEPHIPPPSNSIARAEGLQTLRWWGSFDELGYQLDVQKAQQAGSGVTMPPLPSLPERWMLWLSKHRELLQDRASWRDGLRFLWNDALFGLQPPHSKKVKVDEVDAQNPYSLIDLRTALKNGGYTEPELQVNLALKRHTQSWLGMILYDWTCEYGAAPLRPLVIALALAVLAIPIYWLGIRKELFGGQLLLVEKEGSKEIETVLGHIHSRPSLRSKFVSCPLSSQIQPRNGVYRLRPWLTSTWIRLQQLIVSSGPRLRWEANFLKTVALFSLIGIVNLGFEGLDFGRWIRNLTFSDYDLRARGWIRTASGLQSLVGLGLVALSLLSFFGHPFE